LLDGDVERTYREAGLDYRARFTPLMRVLFERPDASIRELADATGLTHSAASQTAQQMRRAGLVEPRRSRDGRERRLLASGRARELQPLLEARWRATKTAADALDAELPHPLSNSLDHAIAAVQRKSFFDRIAEAESAATSPKTRTRPSGAGPRKRPRQT
jgi:DNA-binding MarR family transcriptional regulator